MTAALLTSLALALTWTPALSLSCCASAKPLDAGETHRTHHDENGPVMRRILHVHDRAARPGPRPPLGLGVICRRARRRQLTSATSALGSDLLPEMDEGGFILDYIMPAGSSLAETNRVLEHVEKILADTPEVEITSRRTGLQLGLAAVTEANTGDITVTLKAKRSRAIDDVIADVRAEIKDDRARSSTSSSSRSSRT